jgi:type IV pilus assembly protein PilB
MFITSPQQLEESLSKVSQFEHKHIGQVLYQSGVITAKQLKDALQYQIQHGKTDLLGHILLKLGYVTDDQIRTALAECLKMPYVKLSGFELNEQLISCIPAEFARSRLVVPIYAHKDRLVVAMENPADNETINMLNFLSERVIEPVISSAEDIEMAISNYYGSSDIEAVLKSMPSVARANSWEAQQAIKLASDKPTVRLVHNLIADAVTRRASDIHIRPKEHSVDILYRIDGSLLKIRSFDRQMLPAAVARIKIISGMNIAEHRLPQDGRTKITNKDHTVDLRVSIIPTIHGESVVLRLLDTSTSLKSINEIGFTDQDVQVFSQLVNKSNGLVLVTGPTGSGKSTTLYAALQSIKDRDINIVTVEDPVEFHIDDVLQIQVNHSIDFSFAKALRNILRHDPDAIMIGEIRDEETAKMAVESSLTGHLVLSTLHTNSAATTVTRLLEIGVPAYLLNATLLAVLAQRLVKKNCEHCLREEDVPSHVRQALGVNESEAFYRGCGCDKCHGTGYSGRLAVYELMQLSPEIRELIQPNVNAADIERAAIKNGMVPLTYNALSLARAKKTSLNEVYRVRLI